MRILPTLLLIAAVCLPPLTAAAHGGGAPGHRHDHEAPAPPQPGPPGVAPKADVNVDPSLIGKTPEAIAKILRGRRRTALAANMPIRRKIAEMVLIAAGMLHRKTKGRVYVIMLSRNTEPTPYVALYGTLGLGANDVLVASNGHDWHIRTALLDAAQLELLETQAEALGRFAPQMRFAVIADSIGAWSADGVKLATTRGTASRPAATASATPLWAFVGGTLLGAVLVLIGGFAARGRASD